MFVFRKVIVLWGLSWGRVGSFFLVFVSVRGVSGCSVVVCSFREVWFFYLLRVSFVVMLCLFVVLLCLLYFMFLMLLNWNCSMLFCLFINWVLVSGLCRCYSGCGLFLLKGFRMFSLDSSLGVRVVIGSGVFSCIVGIGVGNC